MIMTGKRQDKYLSLKNRKENEGEEKETKRKEKEKTIGIRNKHEDEIKEQKRKTSKHKKMRVVVAQLNRHSNQICPKSRCNR